MLGHMQDQPVPSTGFHCRYEITGGQQTMRAYLVNAERSSCAHELLVQLTKYMSSSCRMVIKITALVGRVSQLGDASFGSSLELVAIIRYQKHDVIIIRDCVFVR